MIAIVDKIKVGRAVKLFKCSDGKTYEKDTIVKMIKDKQISNAKVQLWKGEYIVRVDDSNYSVNVKVSNKACKEEVTKTNVTKKPVVQSKVRGLTDKEKNALRSYKRFNGYKVLDENSVAVYYMNEKGDALVDILDSARRKELIISSSGISKEKNIVAGAVISLGENSTVLVDVKAYNLSTGNCKSKIVRLGVVNNYTNNKVEFSCMRGQHKIVVVGERLRNSVSKVGIVIFDSKGNVEFVLDMQNKKAPEIVDLNELDAECEVIDVNEKEVKVKINNKKYRFTRQV